MVTKTVPVEVGKAGTVGQAGQQDRKQAGGGFSDMLGTVSSGSRRQQGTADSSRRSAGRNDSFGSEFRFTEKAAGQSGLRVNDASQSPKSADSFAEQVARTFDSISGGSEKANDLLARAAEIVTQTVRETGVAPDREQAAEMLGEALGIVLNSTEESVSEEDVKIADILYKVLENIVEGPDVMTAVFTADDAPTEDITEPVTPERPVRKPPVAAPFTAKEDEAAMLTSAMAFGEEIAFAAGADTELETELEGMLDPELGIGMMSDETDFAFATDRASYEMSDSFTQESAEVTEEDASIFAELMGSAPKADELAKLFGTDVESVRWENYPADPEMPYTDGMTAVKDTVGLLSDIIEDAKKELGLTDVKLEQTKYVEEDPVVIMQESSAGIRQRMSGADRSGELDHIINGGRFDMFAEDGTENAPKTETYDAVHMAAELMSDRMSADIPVDDAPMFPEVMHVDPPEVQTAEQILDRIQTMQSDRTEFTMVLNPESLGRITVRLVAVGEKYSVEINAENPDTRAILASRTESLQNMLRDNGVQLENYQVVSDREEAQLQQQSYDGSSKNPYSRQDDENAQQDDDDSGDGSSSFYDLLQSL